jgi:3-methyladenine DNA glycosylase AlkC
MTNNLARFETTGRDLIAAVQLGPGPALEAAMNQLGSLVDKSGRSRVSRSELHRLAKRLVENCQPSMQLEVLWLLARHPSLAARAICAYGLAYTWAQEGSLKLAGKLSQDRSLDLQTHLTQSLLKLSPEHKRGLSLEWQTSPHPGQRAIAARLAASHNPTQALEMLTSMSRDDDGRVRESTVEALVDLASDRANEVMQFLQSWAKESDKHKLWVMTRVLSRSPLNRELQSAIAILGGLSEMIAVDKDVRRWTVGVLRALARQHRNLPVQKALSHWLAGGDEILADVATEALRRIA